VAARDPGTPSPARPPSVYVMSPAPKIAAACELWRGGVRWRTCTLTRDLARTLTLTCCVHVGAGWFACLCCVRAKTGAGAGACRWVVRWAERGELASLLGNNGLGPR
jgi:hypothetical protein